MSATLAEQLTCARKTLETMKANNSRWRSTMEAIVKTLERQELLRLVSDSIKGRETQEVEVHE